MRYYIAGIMVFILTGCASLSQTASQEVNIERLTLQSQASTFEIIQAAASLLLTQGFSLHLVNEKIGVIETDFVPLALLAQASLSSSPPLKGQLKISLKVDSLAGKNLIQIHGFMRSNQKPYEQLVALFLLESFTQSLAHAIGTSYTPHITRELLESAIKRSSTPSHRIMRGVIAFGIIAGLIFTVSLLTGTLTP